MKASWGGVDPDFIRALGQRSTARRHFARLLFWMSMAHRTASTTLG